MTPYALLALPLQVRSKPRMSPSCHSQNPGGPLTDMGWEMLSCRGHREVESTEGLRIPDCGQGAAFLGSPCPETQAVGTSGLWSICFCALGPTPSTGVTSDQVACGRGAGGVSCKTFLGIKTRVRGKSEILLPQAVGAVCL